MRVSFHNRACILPTYSSQMFLDRLMDIRLQHTELQKFDSINCGYSSGMPCNTWIINAPGNVIKEIENNNRLLLLHKCRRIVLILNSS